MLMLWTTEYEVWTARIWRTLWSLVIRDAQYANWLVIDKRHNQTYRLTMEEQEFLMGVADLLMSYEMKKERKKRGNLTLVSSIKAINSARNGDDKRMKYLKSLNMKEFYDLITDLHAEDIDRLAD